MPRTTAELIPLALAGVLIFVILLAFIELLQPDNRSNEGVQNLILGLAILGILGTFGIIAYYYRTIDFGSKK